MRADGPLAPGARAVIGELLRAPPGARFEAAVATTYTLDIETALIAPVSLALQAAETRAEALTSPLALLEGLERSLDRLSVFCEAGRIQAAPSPQPRLAALLDGLIVEAAAPGGGAFHPKLWLVRYVRAEGAPLMRLMILSRNMTRDDSWDLCLALDGTVGETRRDNAIGDLVAALPGLATGPVAPRVRALTEALADDCRRTDWQVPAPFETVDFAVNGLGAPPWRPPIGSRVAVIAPFCNPAGLRALAPGRGAARLVARADALAAIAPEVLARFSPVQVLDAAAQTEDGEEPAPDRLTGLHAKCFIAEQGRRTAMTMGSGNATAAALLNGANVEVFATLAGRRKAVGAIDDLLGAEGLGAVLADHAPSDAAAGDPEAEAAEVRLDGVRRALAGAGLVLRCGSPGEDNDRSVPVVMTLARPPGAREDVGAEFWPITLGAAHRRDGGGLLGGAETPIGALALRDLTRFIAFRLTDAVTGAQALFTLGATVENLPEDRDAAVLRAIVDSRAAFLRYLQIILADGEDPFAAARGLVAGGDGLGRREQDAPPLLEAMVRALIAGDGRLTEVRRLVRRLGAGKGGETVIPPEFMDLWQAFRAVLGPVERPR